MLFFLGQEAINFLICLNDEVIAFIITVETQGPVIS